MIVVDYCKIASKYNERGKKRNPATRWAIKVKARDKACRICGTNESLEAHHILSKAEYPHWKYELMNGIALCVNCHNNVHKFVEK